MSEKDWSYLEALMKSFGSFLSDIPYGYRDKGWWDIFYAFDRLVKIQIEKVQPSSQEATK